LMSSYGPSHWIHSFWPWHVTLFRTWKESNEQLW